MKRGRKRKYGDTDFTRTKCWVLLVKHISGLRTFTDVERKLLPHTFSEKNDKDVRGWSSSCVFNRYSAGTKVACPKHIDLAEAAYEGQGTRDFYYHPFWDVVKFSSNNIQDLHLLLARLRPEISNLLFYKSNKNERPRRKPKAMVGETFDILEKESDFDALTACIGLLIEIKIFSDNSPSNDNLPGIYTSLIIPLIIHRIFKRVATQSPYYDVADDLYADINDNQLREDYGTNGKDLFKLRNIQHRIDDNRIILKYIKDTCILRHHETVPLTCLHLAQPYITSNLMCYLHNQSHAEYLQKIKQSKNIRNMKRCLRRWEDKLIATQLTSV